MTLDFQNDRFHFVTGKLAAPFLRTTVEHLADQLGFDYTIQVLNITVAALLTPKWIAPRLRVPSNTTQIILPGYCDGDLSPITDLVSIPVKTGPKDLRDLPTMFGQSKTLADVSESSIEIIAEINHAPRMRLDDIIAQAMAMTSDGADVIDVGCEPNDFWSGVSETVRALKDCGLRVSIDSLNPDEIAPAVAAGAELVLSVNSTNRESAPDWGCEVVVIPDDIRSIESMQDTIDYLSQRDVPLRIDPILEPIGLGFAASVGRYLQARERWPDAEMMMGIGNLTELSDVDSAGVNFTLLGICEELNIRSVLTTQVINWSRSSVRECEIARRLVHYSVRNQVPPKNLSRDLISLRDARLHQYGADNLAEMAQQIKDNNFRIVAENGEIHLLGAGLYLHDVDPFVVFDELAATEPKNLDASHSFYLGYEMCKAMTALTLGKNYAQDDSLDWGHLTQHEGNRHRLTKRDKKK